MPKTVGHTQRYARHVTLPSPTLEMLEAGFIPKIP